MKKRLLSIVVVLAMVIGLMPMTVAADKSGAQVSDENYIKLKVDTGGKGNISLDDYAEDWFPGLMSIHPDEPNVIYVDKEKLVDVELYYDIDDLMDVVKLPEVSGYHNGRPRDYNAFSFDDPSTITNYEQYDDARYAQWR